MELTLDSIKDKHKGKTAVIVVLGPSLNENLAELKELNDNDDLIVFTCNMFDKMIDLKADYWLVCAPMEEMYISRAYNRINNHGATFLFADRIPGFSRADAAKHLTTNYIPVSDVANQPNSLQQIFAKYTSGNTYGPVDTVLLHLISLSVYTGCDNVYIAGADLNYSKGYVKNGVHRVGETIGMLNMNATAKNRTISYAKTMRHSAANVGTNIYTLNPTSPLSTIMDVKVMGDLKRKIMSKKILVTGGSGMVGRSLQDIMPNATYLSSKDCDLTDPVAVDYLIKYTKPDVIIHLAAKVGGIMDNINKPAEYFDDNIIMNTLLLKSAQKYGVERFIGILSTCIYPDKVDTYPMTEDILHEGPPTQTNFSYGYAKRCLAVQIDAYNTQYGTKYQYLTPCNLYGQYDKWGENSHFVAALIKKIMFAAANREKTVPLFGTGTPLRQFMHSDDLAKVIKHCIDNDIYDSFNVATEENISISDIAEIARPIVGAGVVEDFSYDSTKPDGQFRKDVSIKKMQSLIPDFKPTPLKDGIQRTFDYLCKNQSTLI